jgi:geranylgeranyl transferase type-2 subunit beta
MREGLASLAPDRRAAHASAVLASRRDDGGFSGRMGKSDPYYTGFAVRALHALDRISEEVAAGAAGFALRCEPGNVVEALSVAGALLLLDAPHPDPGGLLARLEEFRAADGGYAKSVAGARGDTYLSFLATLCYDVFGLRPPGAERLAQFLSKRSTPDGGFSRSGAVDRGGTNPTAAAVALLIMEGKPDPGRLKPAAQFLVAAQHASGGWTAGARAPLPDLLSTYTALVSLDALGALEAAARSAALAFARACEGPAGGFSALPGDSEVDVEYTYYGLGVLALTG